MAISATDTVQDIINAAVVDAIVALKGATQGLPNALLRDLNAIHSNTAFADLPEPVQKAVAASVRNAFAKLRKEGYVIAEAKSVQPAPVVPKFNQAKGHRSSDQRAPSKQPGQRRPPPRGRTPK